MANCIEFRGVGKRFQATVALRDVSFAVEKGEFHALCGENGAGKSTLMKILAGVITDYEGDIVVGGQTARLTSPRDAETLGIAIIHQELNLVGELSAAANIFLGREILRGGLWLDERQMLTQAADLFSQLGCAIDPAAPVRTLRIGDQQLVEIAKALSLRARILIMDEPTSALTEAEVDRLFEVIGRLRRQGVTIIYISHKMNEVFTHAGCITVLRDGQVIQTLDRAATTPEEVTRLMVGRPLESRASAQAREAGEEVLSVRDFSLEGPAGTRGRRLSGINFSVRRGEVLGIAGLMGAGRTELLEGLYGSSPSLPSGEIRLRGRPVQFEHPREALAAGMAMVSEDRKTEGIIPPMNVREHITLSSLGETTTAVGIVQRSSEDQQAADSVTRLGIKTAGPEASIASLSGGNQQKCLIARALRTRPDVLLLDDPTRGIDVGAKAEIASLIDTLCAEGLALVMTSSELPELLTLCDRILVLCEGRQAAEFTRDQFSQERIMLAATGQNITS